MMVEIVVATVEAIERADDVRLLASVELVRAAEAEHLAIPAERLLKVLAHNDEMAEPLDVRGAALDPEQFAFAAVFVVAGVHGGAGHSYRVEHLHPMHGLELIAVGIG